jgi:helix-turn-helix protein
VSKASERKLADTTGRFAQVIKDGRKLGDVGWQRGRIVLSTRRLVLAGNDGKRTVPLSGIRAAQGRFDINQTIAQVSDYVSVRQGDDVFLVSPADAATFERTLYGAMLDGEVVLIRHPAVEGGVVRDVDWQKARVKLEDERINLATESGELVEIEVDDTSTVERDERTVRGNERPVVEASHTDDGTSVETYLSGNPRHCSIIASVLGKGAARNETDLDLGPSEREVLMALYSGVSSFDIPEFVELPPDDVEEIFDRLIELDVLEEVRVRREVALRPRGRNIASESMNDQ